MEKIKRFFGDPETGTISRLETAAGQVELTAGGTEIGNWLGFCNQKELKGVQADIQEIDVSCEPDEVATRYVVDLPEATFQVCVSERLENGAWLRRASAIALRPSWMGDFVLRLGVKSTDFQTAGHGKRRSRHRNRNTYHQSHIDTVEIMGDRLLLRTTQRSDLESGRLERVSYWRDQRDGQWIQHHRLIVGEDDFDQVVFRVRNSVIDSRGSPWLRNRIFRAPFWAFNENVLSHLRFRVLPTIQAQGVVCVAEGDTFELESRVTVESLGEANG
ncbi:hypothetical protein P1J78_23085 [Psychromarinibacter sp. C21-152]|uniref:Uncharacterized protein n=1 Tax=Psychromarinibacter sediminicola TaxID=3033385 RepID=A0AAE3NSS9_9RHOB|nr:hypothetical protein [Psychromarinibacter sediminicola]MDF0603618.1 hypothetical protein [Psychromarinibacter sediminicola]